MVELLKEWQRTHYSRGITSEMDGNTVIIMGWCREIRDLGGIKFIKLGDRDGSIQLTIDKKTVSPGILEIVDKLGREYVIAVKGTVKKNKHAPSGIEIIPRSIKVLNKSDSPLPLEIETKKTPAELPTRLDARYMDMRKRNISSIFKIADTIKRGFIEYFAKQEFVHCNTPVIVAAATEGGSDLFSVKYFEKEVFLSQSPQLYKQMLMSTGLDRVSIVTPVFRAEPHDTYRHLNETIQMDIEVAFVRHEEDVLKYYDGVLKYIYEKVKNERVEELKNVGVDIKIPKTPIKRLNYDEVVDILNKEGIKMKWGDDITSEGERKICELFNPVIVKKWPTAIRAFYSMPEPENPKICRAYDLLVNGLEISSGAQRVHIHEDLVNILKKKGLDPKDFNFYLEPFKYGMPPHGGWSIGLERITMAMLKLPNIREATLFPRTKSRVTP